MSRYHTMDFILNKPYADGIKLIKKAYEQVSEDKIFMRWAFGYQQSMSLDDFKREITTPKFTKSDKEILADVKSIIDSMGVQNG
jgi:hypothetical protein